MKVCSVCQHCYDDSTAFCVDDSHPALSETHSSDRRMIAGYRLESLLDSRAGIETYRALQIESGQFCRIRIVRADESADHFLSEAKLAAAFFHPNVVDVYEAGTLESGEMFAVSEDAEGRTLRQFQDDLGAPELLTSILIVRQAAEALHAMHLSGMTHRAVRPENIILTKDKGGGLLVRIQNPDLGGVAERSTISNKFLIDSYVDRLRYFSPEQCSDDRAGPQSDVYSLGIVFYEMLAGAPPFDAATAVGLIHKQRNEAPPDLKINNFDLRMLVTHSVTEALHKQPRLRQSSANTLARQLRHIEQLATHTSTPPPAGAVTARPAPPKPVSVPAVVYAPKSVSALTARAEAHAEVVTAVPEVVTPEPTPIQQPPVSIPDVPEVQVSLNMLSARESVSVIGRSLLDGWKEKLHSLAQRLAPVAKPDSIMETATEIAVPALAEFSETPMRVEPKKIELDVPEDIPSVAGVLEILASETAPEIYAVEHASKKETIKPPMIEVRAAQQAKPEVVSTPAVIETPITQLAKPEVVETPLVIETPIAQLAKPDAIETPVVVETPVEMESPNEEAVEIPAPKKPARVEAPPVFIPRVKRRERPPAPAVAGSFGNSSPQTPRSIRPSAPPQKHSPKKSGLGFRVNRADLEEITLVRPPAKRIKIDWDRVVARPDLASILSVQKLPTPQKEVQFVPTILGETLAGKEPERREGMFAAFDSGAGSRFATRHRSVLIGIGVMGLTALLLFGNDSITRYFQAWSSADSITAETTTKVEPTPAAKTSVPVKKAVAKNTEKDRASRTTEKAPAASRQSDSKARPVSSKARVTAPNVAPSKFKPEAVKRSPAKTTPSKPRTPGESTRPRVVKTVSR